ncbi:MAG: hypothetical protein AAF587_15100 [Bacteroidota bacterium]
MKPFFSICIVSFSIYLLSCNKDPLSPSTISNPCKKTVVSISKIEGYGNITINSKEGNGADTVFVDYVEEHSQADEYHVFTYDEGLTRQIDRYETATSSLLIRTTLEWWEKGKEKLISHFDESGQKRTESEYDSHGNIIRFQAFGSQATLAQQIMYTNVYHPDGRIKQITAIDHLKNDTAHIRLFVYDANKLLVTETRQQFLPHEQSLRTEYTYDSENRLIEENKIFEDSGRLQEKKQTEYIQGELEKRINYIYPDVDSTLVLSRYIIYTQDQYQNPLLTEAFHGNTHEQLYRIESFYECDE